jgi:hypothetical protein
LRDEGKNVIATNCDASAARIARIGPLRLTSTGSYSLSVHDDYIGNGRYSLIFQRTNKPGRAEILSSGDNQLVFLNTCGEVHTYTFKARERDRIKIDMIKAEMGNIDPRLELYDPQGKPIEAAGKGNIDRTLTTSGTFALLAYSSGTQTGTYRISLTITPATLDIPLVATGQAPEGMRQTTLVLVNPSDAPITGMMEFFVPDGVTPMEVCIRGVCDVQFPISIRAGGTQILETDAVMRPLAQGIARITANVGGLKANVVL